MHPAADVPEDTTNTPCRHLAADVLDIMKDKQYQ
jgi:hypothetical protein